MRTRPIFGPWHRRAIIGVAVIAVALSGCGAKTHKAAEVSTSSAAASATTTTPSTTPSVDTADPSAVEASVDSSLNDINSDLSAVDAAPSDEGDPTQ